MLIDHKPGMLALTLQAFGVRGVNLMALQSRPERSAPWTYRFYVDIDGATTDPRVAEALEEVEALAAKVVILGSYEAWVEGSRLACASTDARAPHAEAGCPAHRPPPQPRGEQGAGAPPRLRRRGAGAHRRPLLGGERGDDPGDRGRGRGGGWRHAPRRRLQASHVSVRLPGTGVKGLRYLADARERTGLPVVTEVLSWEEVAVVAHFADMLQIGARNMQNFTLLRAASRSGKPILLKRGAGATIEEWLMAAEYMLAEGNPNVVLCERGIRTFERATRHTLDLNAVAMVRERTHLPVVVDPSHAAGVRSLVKPLSLASLAAGRLRADRGSAPRSRAGHERRRAESRCADVRRAGRAGTPESGGEDRVQLA